MEKHADSFVAFFDYFFIYDITFWVKTQNQTVQFNSGHGSFLIADRRILSDDISSVNPSDPVQKESDDASCLDALLFIEPQTPLWVSDPVQMSRLTIRSDGRKINCRLKNEPLRLGLSPREIMPLIRRVSVTVKVSSTHVDVDTLAQFVWRVCTR